MEYSSRHHREHHLRQTGGVQVQSDFRDTRVTLTLGLCRLRRGCRFGPEERVNLPVVSMGRMYSPRDGCRRGRGSGDRRAPLPLFLFVMGLLFLVGCSPWREIPEPPDPMIELPRIPVRNIEARFDLEQSPGRLAFSKTLDRYRIEYRGRVYLGRLTDPETVIVVDQKTANHAVYSKKRADSLRSSFEPDRQRRRSALNSLERGLRRYVIDQALEHPCEQFQRMCQVHPTCRVESESENIKLFHHVSTLFIKPMFGTEKVVREMTQRYDTRLGLIVSVGGNLSSSWSMTDVRAPDELDAELFEPPLGSMNILDLEVMASTPGPLFGRDTRPLRLLSLDVWDQPLAPEISEWLLIREILIAEIDDKPTVNVLRAYPAGPIDLDSLPLEIADRPTQGGMALRIRGWDTNPPLGERFCRLDERTFAFVRQGVIVRVSFSRVLPTGEFIALGSEIDRVLQASGR